MPDSAISIAILCLPFIASVAALLIGGAQRNRVTWLMTGTAAICLLLSVWLYPAIADGEALRTSSCALTV